MNAIIEMQIEQANLKASKTTEKDVNEAFRDQPIKEYWQSEVTEEA